MRVSEDELSCLEGVYIQSEAASGRQEKRQ